MAPHPIFKGINFLAGPIQLGFNSIKTTIEVPRGWKLMTDSFDANEKWSNLTIIHLSLNFDVTYSIFHSILKTIQSIFDTSYRTRTNEGRSWIEAAPI